MLPFTPPTEAEDTIARALVQQSGDRFVLADGVERIGEWDFETGTMCRTAALDAGLRPVAAGAEKEVLAEKIPMFG